MSPPPTRVLHENRTGDDASLLPGGRSSMTPWRARPEVFRHRDWHRSRTWRNPGGRDSSGQWCGNGSGLDFPHVPHGPCRRQQDTSCYENFCPRNPPGSRAAGLPHDEMGTDVWSRKGHHLCSGTSCRSPGGVSSSLQTQRHLTPHSPPHPCKIQNRLAAGTGGEEQH